MKPWEMNYGEATGGAPKPWEMNYGEGGAEASAPISAEGAEEPGFFERAKDTAINTTSDILTSLTGGNVDPAATPDTSNIPSDILERFGSPADTRSPAENVQTAVAQGLSGVGQVGMDAAMSAGKAILPEPLQDKIGEGFDAVMNSDVAKAAGSMIDSASEAIGPDASRRVGELAEMATVALPKAKIPGKGTQRNVAKAAKKMRDSQEKVVSGRRRDKVQAMLEPEDGYGKGETDLNAAGTSVYTPSEFEMPVIEEVTKLKGIKPGRSLRYNEAVIAKAARSEVEAVNKRIDRAGNPKVDTDKLNTEINDVFVDVDRHGFPMSGDVKQASERLIEKARRLIEESDGTANGVLQARRDFDGWAKLNKPKVHSPDSESAVGIATRVVREAMNDHIDALVPSAKVKPSLEKTHLLLKAKADLRPKAAKTAKTKLGRIIEKMKGHLPTTPLAQWSTLGAGWAVATQPWVAAIAALAGTGYVGAKAIQYGTREWRGALAKAISGMEKTLKAGEAPAKVLADIRADKLALVEMLKDERMHKDEVED
jgi:hypothetical protein